MGDILKKTETKKTEKFPVIAPFKHGQDNKEYKVGDSIELSSQKAIDYLKSKRLIN